MSRKTRKLIWSAPLVAVLAVAGALALFVALTPNGAQAHDLPGPVSDLTAEGTSWSAIKLTWKAPTTGGGVTGYRIDISTDEFIWEALVMDTGNTQRTYTHSGLKGDQTRYFRVFALNAAGAGTSPVGDDASNDLFVAGTTLPAEAPGQVLNLRATGVSNSQIDVMWDGPTSTGGADINNYCLIVGATRDHVVDIADVDFDGCTGEATATLPGGDDDDAAVNSLVGIRKALNAETPSKGYLIVIDTDKPPGHEGHWPMLEHKGLNSELKLYYRLYAVNSVEPSATATNIVSATTKKTPKPAAPRGLKLVSTGPSGNAINLYWNWPANALKTPANGFYFQYRSSTVRTWSTAVAEDGATFPVQATHSFADVAGIVNPVEAVDATESDAAVRARKAATYLEYRVMVGMNGTASSVAKINLVAPMDPDSNTLADRNPTLPTVLELPGEAAPVLNDDLSFESTLRTIALTWERKGDPAVDPDPAEKLPTGFVIDAVMGKSVDNPVGFQTLQANTTYTGKVRGTDTTSIYTHKGVMPAQDWYYRVFPYTSGKQWYGNPILRDANTKPAEAPDQYTCSQVSAAADGPTKIALTWPAPGEDGGSPVIGFLVQVNEDDDGDGSRDSDVWPPAPLGGLDAAARSYTYAPKGADALSSGTIRWLRVIVLNAVNTDETTGALSETIDLESVCTIKGETDESGNPGQPDGLVTEPARDAGSLDPDNPVPNSERGVLLLWNAPDDPAGDTVTEYVIARRVRDDSTSAWGDWENDWAEIDASATSYTDTEIVAELDNGETRQYRVAALSGSGTGMWTPVVTYPHSAETHVLPSNTLTAPSGVMATVGVTDPGAITVTWTPGENATEGHLVLLFNSDFTEVPHVGVPTGEGMYTIPDVTTGGDYVVVVVSVKSRSEYLYDYARVNVP